MSAGGNNNTFSGGDDTLGEPLLDTFKSGYDIFTEPAGTHNHTVNGDSNSTGVIENRVKNYSINYIIKSK